MAIPDIWRYRRVNPSTRALNNIALHRLAPGSCLMRTGPLHLVQTPKLDDGKENVLLLQPSGDKRSHYMRLSKNKCRGLVAAQENNPGMRVALLAMWHGSPGDPVQVWNIPLEIVNRMDAALPSDRGNLHFGNVRIHPGRPGKWVSASSGIAADVNILSCFEEWELDEEEIRHIAEMEGQD